MSVAGVLVASDRPIVDAQWADVEEGALEQKWKVCNDRGGIDAASVLSGFRDICSCASHCYGSEPGVADAGLARPA